MHTERSTLPFQVLAEQPSTPCKLSCVVHLNLSSYSRSCRRKSQRTICCAFSAIFLRKASCDQIGGENGHETTGILAPPNTCMVVGRRTTMSELVETASILRYTSSCEADSRGIDGLRSEFHQLQAVAGELVHKRRHAGALVYYLPEYFLRRVLARPNPQCGKDCQSLSAWHVH